MPTYHKRVIIDEWIIMPNHIHLLITLGNYDFDNRKSLVENGAVEKIHEFSVQKDEKIQGFSENQNEKIQEFSVQKDVKIQEISVQQMQQQYRQLRRKMIIPKILGKLQQQTSKQINIIRNTPGIKNWQKDYYDHVIPIVIKK